MKRNKLLLLAISGIFFLCLCSNFGRAAYSENIEIDCQLDSEYTQIAETDNYTLYYANSETQSYLFISFNFNLTNHSISISSGEFSYDLSPEEVQTNFLHSLHINQTLELMVSRDSVGDNIEISLEDIDMSIMLIVPSAKPSEPATPPDQDSDEKEKDDKEEKDKLDPFGDFFGMWDAFITPNAWWLWIPSSLFVASAITFISRYVDKPVIFARKNTTKKFEDFKLGRPVVCKQAAAPLGQYWEYIFKSNAGIKKYYCKFNYATLERWIETTKLPPFEKYMGHIIPLTVKLPLSLQPVLKQRRKKVPRKHFAEKLGNTRTDYLNALAYYFYRFICIFIPSGWIGYGVYSLVKYEDATDDLGHKIKQEAITVLVHEATLKHITTVRKVTYQYRDYSSGKEKIKTDTRTLALFQIAELRKDPNFVKFVRKRKYKINVREYDDPAEALQVIASKAELQSIHDLEMQEIMNRLENVEIDLLKANRIISNLKAEKYRIIEDTITAKENESILDDKTLIQILARSHGIKELTGKPLEAMIEAVKSVLHEQGSSEIIKLKAALAEKTQLVELLKNQVNDLRDMLKRNGSEVRSIDVRSRPLTDNFEVK